MRLNPEEKVYWWLDMSSLRLALAASLAESRGGEDGESGGGSGSPHKSGLSSSHHVRKHRRTSRAEELEENNSVRGGDVIYSSLNGTPSSRTPR